MFLADIQNPVHSVWFEVANYVEFIILCTNIVVITITARMVTSSTPLHRNLVLLLYNLVVTEFFVTIIRCTVLIISFHWPYAIWDTSSPLYEPLYYLTMAQFIGLVAFLCHLPHVVAERGFATFMFSTYEKQNNIYIIVFGCFLQYMCGAVTVCLFHLGLVSLPVCIYTGLGIVFISVTCYFIFNAINQRRYQKSISVGTTYTLSQKFQLSENIRTSSLLSRACVVSALMNTLQCLAFVSVHHLEDDPLLAQIMFTVGNFSIACYGLVLPLLGLSLDKRVVGLFKRQLSLIFPFVDAEKSEDSELNLQRADGAPMVFDQEQEVNKYFGELNKAWA
ncbi:hypothetical protein Y032_0086g1994 [Ancylostoma ceylanicum]|uniref:Sre G protein-coupled chemoreceptor n=2 Tax=Ancylostoma ceylanicum TaxID=53326 RepID=A0A016TPT9_9BILA|nr:hypothetical protein Y032_0086g1994 [Ancylostoma ceylanicum]